MSNFSPESGESVSFEEYWDGHHKQDSCPILDSNRLEPTPLRNTGIFNQAQEALKPFEQLPYHNPIRVFSEGTVFDAKQFPEGSIIRYNGEHYSEPIVRLSFLGLRPDYLNWYRRYGVICGFDHNGKRVVKIVGFEYLDPLKYRPGGNQPNYIFDSVIRVGEVMHTKEKMRFFPPYQTFERFQRIELMGIGKGVQRKTTEIETATLPNHTLGAPETI